MESELIVPGFTKLIDYVASGVGAIAGPILEPWAATRRASAKITEAHADAERIRIIGKAIADTDAQRIRTIAKAQADARRIANTDIELHAAPPDLPDMISQRVEYQERKRHYNITSAVFQAADILGDGNVPDREPDHDWTARLFEGVQDVSDEKVRRIWAKILAGEVQSPGSISLRTLSVLRVMSRSDAELFREVVKFRLDDLIPWYIIQLTDGTPLTEQDVFRRLPDIGVVHTLGVASDLGLSRHVTLDNNGTAICVNADQVLIFRGKPGSYINTSETMVVLTEAGYQLAPFCGAESELAVLELFATLASKHAQATLDVSQLLGVTSDGPKYDQSKLHRIESVETPHVY